MAGENVLREYQVRKGKGRAFIININPIDEACDNTNTLGWAKRSRDFVGSDTEALKKQFKACGYEVVEHAVDRKAEVETKIEYIKQLTLQDDYKDVDALVIIFSGYGDEGTLFCSNGNVEINEVLLRSFKGDECPNLASKPKLFILQTCNHPQYQFEGPETFDGPDDEALYKKDAAKRDIYKIPAEANFVFIQCLIPGKAPWRDQSKGSMFLSTFCKHMENSPPEGLDINQIMQRARTDIDQEMMDNARKVYEGTWKKLPLMSSTLTKKFRFRKQ